MNESDQGFTNRTTRGSDASRQHQPLWGFEPAKLGKLRARDVAIRFCFGALTSLLAGIVGMAVSPAAGGLFLAFPAILAASLTLVERKDGRQAARHDAGGAVLGAVALIAFALLGSLLLSSLGLGGLACATAGWCCVSFALYLVRRRGI